MDEAGSGEVAVAGRREPTVARPAPVGDDRVHETGDEKTVAEIRGEGAALGDGAGNDGGSGGRKDELEEPLRPRGSQTLTGESIKAYERVAVGRCSVGEGPAEEPIGKTA